MWILVFTYPKIMFGKDKCLFYYSCGKVSPLKKYRTRKWISYRITAYESSRIIRQTFSETIDKRLSIFYQCLIVGRILLKKRANRRGLLSNSSVRSSKGKLYKCYRSLDDFSHQRFSCKMVFKNMKNMNLWKWK